MKKWVFEKLMIQALVNHCCWYLRIHLAIFLQVLVEKLTKYSSKLWWMNRQNFYHKVVKVSVKNSSKLLSQNHQKVASESHPNFCQKIIKVFVNKSSKSHQNVCQEIIKVSVKKPSKFASKKHQSLCHKLLFKARWNFHSLAYIINRLFQFSLNRQFNFIISSFNKKKVSCTLSLISGKYDLPSVLN